MLNKTLILLCSARLEVLFLSCYHPLLAVNLGIKKNGKKDIRILSRSTIGESSFVSAYEDCERIKREHGDSRFVFPYKAEKYVVSASDFFPIPCGKCIGCQLAKSREWAARCMLEMKYHKSAYFVTLTYDDAHIHKVESNLERDFSLGTLCKRDLQLFMKRLRKEFNNQQIRFFACGEYGSKSLRPHYHLILFGLKLPDDDLHFWKMSKSKVGGCYSKIYNSDIISRLWPYGLNAIGDVTFESVAYVARYTTKKLNHENVEDFGLQKEFIVMSRRPGIAYKYFSEHGGEIYDFDEILVEKGGKPFKCRPSKYYDRLFDIDNHDAMELVKAKRKTAAENCLETERKKTDKTLTDYIKTKEANKLASFEKLRRVL